MKSFFKHPLFWTNVITLSFVLFLTASIVFGWTNPTANPPGGGGAIQVNGSGDLVLAPSGHIDASGKRMKNMAVPTAGTDGTTKTWVESQLSNKPQGNTVTLWAGCKKTDGSSCSAGDNVPQCSALNSSGSIPNLFFAELYAGFGPFTLVSPDVTSKPFDASNPEVHAYSTNIFDSMSSLAICRDPMAYPNYPTYGWILDGSSGDYEGGYRAYWRTSSADYANTCRVCVAVPQ